MRAGLWFALAVAMGISAVVLLRVGDGLALGAALMCAVALVQGAQAAPHAEGGEVPPRHGGAS